MTAFEWRISDWSSDVCSSDLAGRLGADRDRRFVDDLLDQVDASPLTAEQRVAGDRDILEINLRRAVAVDGRIVAADDAGQRRVDQEQRHAVAVALTAAGAPGDPPVDRKSGAWGKRGSGRVELGGG